MYMPLVTAEDGIVQFVKQPGVSLEPGDILGILTLDDPTCIKHAKPFKGLLPNLVTWRFNLGQSHSQPLTPCIEQEITDSFRQIPVLSIYPTGLNLTDMGRSVT